jgi:hypothetical protein
VERLARASLLPVVLAGGCVGKFKTPSAYMSQVYLCDPAHASQFQSIVDGCTSASCAGAFSLTGTLQGEPVTMGGQLAGGQFFVVQTPGSTIQQWDQAKMNGMSPYFNFVFHLVSIGGKVGDPPSATRTLNINSAAPSLNNSLADSEVQAGQFLEVSGASADLIGLTNSGSVVISELSPAEVRGTFHGQFGTANDVVDGCFAMLPTIPTGVNPAPSP